MNTCKLPRARIGSSSVILICIGVTAGLTGCSTLTKSRVKAVAEFADQTKNYGTLPGQAVGAYGTVLRQQVQLTQAATSIAGVNQNETVDTIVKALKNGRKNEQQAKDIGDQADKAFAVLQSYSDGLTVLASDKFTDSLDSSAEQLGKSINSSIEKYNKSGGSKLSNIGGYTAQAVTTIGGIYIRNRQQAYLKKFTSSADSDIIPKLSNDVISMMSTLKKYTDSQRVNVYEAFKGALIKRQMADLDVIQRYDEMTSELDAINDLADAASKSARKYQVAHHALTVALAQEPHNFSSFIEEIEALKSQVEAGQNVAKKLQNK